MNPRIHGYRKNPGLVIGVGILVLACWTAAAFGAEWDQLSTTLNGEGAISANTVAFGGREYRHVGAGMQPGGVMTSAGGTLVNRGGFLQAVSLKRPDLDTDGNGIPDELDRDNDGDGLADRDEIDGTAFGGYARTDPNNPDTDGDGMSDADEAAGMYDPLDPHHLLEIVGLTRAGGNVTIRWIGKGGGTVNAIMANMAPFDGSFAETIVRQAYAGGAHPWYKATHTHTASDNGPGRFLRAETE